MVMSPKLDAQGAAVLRPSYLVNVTECPLVGRPGSPMKALTAATVTRMGGWSFGVQIPDQVQDADANTSSPNTLAKVMTFLFFLLV